ncbi:hypothetical protein EDC04DRAFT_1900040 [Pisolithus marmoratus]|nr:hypothetical protein EDC04DRAFT_1900040 [Pisolithus marmoratus]
MLGVNYRTSPIIVDEFISTPTSGAAAVYSAYGETQEGILRAGDLAPDAPGLVPVISPGHTSVNIRSGPQSNEMAGRTRMFDIFASTHHTVIFHHFCSGLGCLCRAICTCDARPDCPEGLDHFSGRSSHRRGSIRRSGGSCILRVCGRGARDHNCGRMSGWGGRCDRAWRNGAGAILRGCVWEDRGHACHGRSLPNQTSYWPVNLRRDSCKVY